ncbi:Integrase [Roseivivax lentus]|uniref:Integrase n=1 Tax=Roseivivax lentus TaxID=633194 RepID=A0A1N7MRY9_9RHOB|nr:tyrosine-type recombinase/integrase [Roseivivax lentus]SIS88907.1 Integrase [Roseivivax lentus]
MPLTQLECVNAKPTKKRYERADRNGLSFVVWPNGKRRWCYRYRLQGQQKRFWLGDFPTVGLTEARALADAAALAVKGNHNPASVDLTELGPDNFQTVAKAWFDNQKHGWSQAYATRVWSRIDADLNSQFGTRPIVGITRKDVLEALRAIEERGAVDMAKRVKQYAENIFMYAMNEEIIDGNPASGLEKSLKKNPPVKHHAKLKADELPTFFSRLHEYEGECDTRIALKLIMHTILRTSELLGIKKEDIDLENRLLRLPAARMKMARDHLVPLTNSTASQFQILIDRSDGGRLFSMSSNTMIYSLYRMGYHSRATVHGFRGTASTILNESGLWRPNAIERQLAHVSQNTVRNAYNHAEYLPERRKMMSWYSNFLDRCEYQGKLLLESNHQTLDSDFEDLTGGLLD